jgi:hypothetical protein
VVARRAPAEKSVPVAPPPPPPPAVDTNPNTDFASYTKSRQEQREALENLGRQTERGSSEGEDLTDEQKRDRIIAQNLQIKKPGISGIFRITNMGQRVGSFEFLGWTTNQRLAKSRTFEVDAGFGGNVELAIVRRMIALIRDYYKGDFNFESQRLNKVVKLSARPEDNAYLEDFLRREFFGTPR